MVLEIDRRVRERWGDFESFPLTIVQDEDLLVTVAAPLHVVPPNSLVDMLRSGTVLSVQAVWTSMVVVAITPRRLSAVDIELVALSRRMAERSRRSDTRCVRCAFRAAPAKNA